MFITCHSNIKQQDRDCSEETVLCQLLPIGIRTDIDVTSHLIISNNICIYIMISLN